MIDTIVGRNIYWTMVSDPATVIYGIFKPMWPDEARWLQPMTMNSEGLYVLF